MNIYKKNTKNFICKFISSKKLLLIFCILFFSFVNSLFAVAFSINDLYFPNDKKIELKINDTSYVNIFYEKQFEDIARIIKNKVKETHETYANLFGKIDNFTLTIKIINKKDFFSITKIPNWINAIYYKKNIIFPISKNNNKFDIELLKSLRHEYMHAYIYKISHGKCAGWLDEGLAQWAEGSTNPKLWIEFKKFLSNHNALPLNNLANSYITMPTYLVPVAYAESLIGVKYLINYYGFEKFKILFNDLYIGIPFQQSFQNAFNLETAVFDYNIGRLFASWKSSPQKPSFDTLINFTHDKEFNSVMGQFKEKK